MAALATRKVVVLVLLPWAQKVGTSRLHPVCLVLQSWPLWLSLLLAASVASPSFSGARWTRAVDRRVCLAMDAFVACLVLDEAWVLE